MIAAEALPVRVPSHELSHRSRVDLRSAILAASRRAGLVLLAGIAAFLVDAGAASQTQTIAYSEFDMRASLNANLQPTEDQWRGMAALPGAAIRWNEREGVPSEIIRYGGYLTGPNADAAAFLRSNAGLLGLSAEEIRNLTPVDEYPTAHNGATHLFLQQTDRGRSVYGSLIKVTLDSEGRIVIMGGSYFAGATAGDSPTLTAEQAVRAAAANVGARPSRPLVGVAREAGPGQKATFENSVATRLKAPSPITVELVTFPMPGRLPARLAWKTSIEADSGWYEIVIDAHSGEPLYRTNYAAYAGPEGNVFTVQNPNLGSQHIVSFAGAPFDNAGWVRDRTTAGNNANVYQDLDNDDSPDYQPQTPPSGDPAYQHFNYTFTDALRTSGGTDVTTDRDAAITQAFYRINFLHDYFYALGFDEPAGNFQEDNFGRGGVGGDSMFIEIDNGFNVGTPENPNTQTPPGGRPRMELNANSVADGAMDADLVTHEYTHGVSNRLVAGEVPGGGLPYGVQTWALGEGWSDFFGTSIYDDPIAGEYVCGDPIHGCPLYAYDNSPLVYSDLCTLHPTGCEPHRDGEIWTATLWDLRTGLIDRYGAGPGKSQAEQLVIDGMKNTAPPGATYLDARDGILAADMTNNAGANQCLIWRVFAGREMGLNAATSADQKTVTPDTTVPATCEPTADADGPYTTTEGTDQALSGVGSTPGADSSAGTIVLYEWDLDNDGQYDDATGSAPSFTSVGQDGVFSIGLRVTNSAGLTDTDSTTITVTNAAPVVSLDAISTSDEGTAITLSGTGSDAGWLDSLTATVDWDDGGGQQPLSGVVENIRPDATLTFSQEHTYGDNGTFVINVCVSDDDTTTCKNVSAVVSNVDPTATIDPSGQSTYDGISVYTAHAGDAISVAANSTDPGSDDLTLTWDWGSGPDTVVVSLVNPPIPDPAKSPSLQPRDVTLSRSHTYGGACLYDLAFSSVDDDGGSASDQATAIIVGNATRLRGSGWWLNQYRLHPPNALSPQTMECYLDIVVFMSTVFDTPLDRADAVDILFVNQNKGTAEELFDKQLLAAWLNFANGAIELGDPVDTDGDGVNDSTFGAAMLTAENVRNSPASTRGQLLAQKDILERIVLAD
jgi:hypothetical protein